MGMRPSTATELQTGAHDALDWALSLPVTICLQVSRRPDRPGGAWRAICEICGPVPIDGQEWTPHRVEALDVAAFHATQVHPGQAWDVDGSAA